jgi:hypothetical protein
VGVAMVSDDDMARQKSAIERLGRLSWDMQQCSGKPVVMLQLGFRIFTVWCEKGARGSTMLTAFQAMDNGSPSLKTPPLLHVPSNISMRR